LIDESGNLLGILKGNLEHRYIESLSFTISTKSICEKLALTVK
jgi:hypothetical protein